MFGLEPPSLADDADGGLVGSGSGSGSAGSGSGSGSGSSSTPIAFVQYACNANWNAGTSLAATYPSAQHGGDLSVIAVSWADPGTVKSVTDSTGNAWIQIATPVSGGGKSHALYYSPSIRDGANTVTVAFTSTVSQSWLKVLEYGGVVETDAVDITAAQSGSGANVTSGTGQTTHAHDLILGAATFGTDLTSTGTGYVQRVRCYGDLVQDQVVTASGSYAATATLTQSMSWTMRMVAFVGQ